MEASKATKSRAAIMYKYWKQWVARYSANWFVAFCLQVGFFGLSAIIPFLFKQVIDTLTTPDFSLLNKWIVIFILVEGVQIVLLYSRGYATRTLELKVQENLKAALYSKLHTGRYPLASRTKPGDAIQRITSDAANTKPLAVEGFSELVGHVILVIIIIIFMFALSPYLAIISLVFIGLYAIGYRVYQINAPKLAQERQAAQAQFISTTEEGLDALYTIRVHGAYRNVMKVYREALKDFLNKGFAFYKYNLKFQGVFTSLISYLASVGVLVLGAWLVLQGHITIGVIVAFSQYISWLVVFVNFMSGYATTIEPAIVSYNRVNEILDWKTHWLVNDCSHSVQEQLKHKNAISIDGLSFAYNSDVLFDNLNLDIESNKTTLIVGASGRGKSTLLNIMLGLYEVEDNTVFIDGTDINKLVPADVLGLISVVEQEPKFFGDSVADNLLSCDNTPLAEIETKAELLGLDSVLNRLAAGDGGKGLKNLSGGERKRLGILRGLSRERPIVIMDEPTAFVDETNAKAILKKVFAAFPDTTFIIFSHDATVEEFADVVVNL